VALRFAESDLHWRFLSQRSYRKGTINENAKRLLEGSVGFGRGSVMVDHMFIFQGIAASGKFSLLKAMVELLSYSSFSSFSAE